MHVHVLKNSKQVTRNSQFVRMWNFFVINLLLIIIFWMRTRFFLCNCEYKWLVTEKRAKKLHSYVKLARIMGRELHCTCYKMVAVWRFRKPNVHTVHVDSTTCQYGTSQWRKCMWKSAFLCHNYYPHDLEKELLLWYLVFLDLSMIWFFKMKSKLKGEKVDILTISIKKTYLCEVIKILLVKYYWKCI